MKIGEDLIKNPEVLKNFENRFVKEQGKLTYSQSLKIFESMWNEGVRFGVLPTKDPLEGIEIDIHIAKILNSCLRKS